MRVTDAILNSVGFIAEVSHSDTLEEIDFQATGFVTALPSVTVAGGSFPVFVTAKHVAQAFVGKETKCIVNKKGGGTVEMETLGGVWYPHPTDDSVDVAVIPCRWPPEAEIIGISLERFLTPQMISEKKVGIGDEVVVPGLFTYVPGSRKNTPILRQGNLAMLPEEPIQVDSGFAEVYLIEARSIGGMSGSPVFVRPTMALEESRFLEGSNRMLLGVSSDFRLLGLVHGHWDIKESEINSPRIVPNAQRGVNLGIAVVVPAHKILETIHHPELLAIRDEHDRLFKNAILPTPDGM